MKAMAAIRPALVAACAIILSSCGWMGAKETPPLPGERLSVLQFEGELKPDPAVAGTPVALPAPFRNTSWTQVGGGALHAVGHVEGPAEIGKPAWKVDIGSGAGRYRPLMSEPAIADGRVFTMDSKYRLSAYDTGKGKRIWRKRLEIPRRDGESFGGGIAYDSGILFASTGFSKLFALKAEDGEIAWQQDLPGPVRASPLVLDGAVYVVTVDNQLIAMDAATGERRWRHQGFAEPAALLGTAAPAGIDESIIVPYSSGEIFALRAANGRANWSDNLAAVRRADTASSLADITALPVTDGSLVYAVSHSGRTVAIDLRTGARAWERNVGGVRTPWIAGEWMFIVNNEAQVVCLRRRDGRVRWVAQLERYEDPEDREDPIHWLSPMAVGGRLLLIGGHGKGVALDPADGSALASLKLPDEVMAAAIADGTLYLQTENGKLLAYR